MVSDKTYEVNGKVINVKVYKGVETYKWDFKRFMHKVRLTLNGHSIFFVYYGSYNDYCKGKYYVEDVNNVMDCVVSDAYSYIMYPILSEFMRAYGYSDYNTNKARKVFNGCFDTYIKLINVGLTEGDIINLIDIINKEYDR